MNGPSPDEWLEQLVRERRVIPLTVGGETRYVAVEDAAKYRDALGIPLPLGLPESLLEPVPDALEELVARYARTHGPFRVEEVSAHLGVGPAPVLGALNNLRQAGRLVQGEFRPGGSGVEWCDAGVLRALRQKSLARLRHQVEPVEQPALGRLYLAWQRITGGEGTGAAGADGLLEVLEQLQGAPVPASVLESHVLPARLRHYDPRELDALTSSGSLIWVGCESLGQRDGRVALYLTEHAPLLVSPKPPGSDGPLHQQLREHLSTRGASFFPQMLQACGGAFHREVVDALWDLVWSGEVTNDTLQPVRGYLHPRSARRPARPRRGGSYSGGGRLSPRYSAPPEAVGRWSLVSSLVDGSATNTERAAARVRQWLDRYGILTREAAQAETEGGAGGFSAVYPVLKAMEESGQVRRGYFVAGRGATQFGLPGAVDRLRALREPPEEMEAVLLAATDPANPYGAALPWPEREEGRRAARMAGAVVILVDGALAAWMGRLERNLLTFFDQVPERDPAETAAAVAGALARQVGPSGRRALFVREVDGVPVAETPMAPALAAAGFTYGPHGYMKRW